MDSTTHTRYCQLQDENYDADDRMLPPGRQSELRTKGGFQSFTDICCRDCLYGSYILRRAKLTSKEDRDVSILVTIEIHSFRHEGSEK